MVRGVKSYLNAPSVVALKKPSSLTSNYDIEPAIAAVLFHLSADQNRPMVHAWICSLAQVSQFDWRSTKCPWVIFINLSFDITTKIN